MTISETQKEAILKRKELKPSLPDSAVIFSAGGPNVPSAVLSQREEERLFWEGKKGLYSYMDIGLHYRMLVKTVRSFIDPKTGQTWLDAGCGPGNMSKLLNEKSEGSLKKIISLDIVESPVFRERQKTVPMSEFVHGSLSNCLPLESGVLDGIVSNIVIPYVVDFEGIPGKEGIKNLFKEFARVLKPGGQFVWSSPKRNIRTEICFISAAGDILWNAPRIHNLPVIAYRLLKYGKELEKKGKKGIYTYLDPPEWDEILKEAGFISRDWKFVFTCQVWVNNSYRA